ncbi:hypothetical protein Pmar_PMAR006309 [Perkinsus marinus ATCC 50983]|nr:hypothetical protein Pmar_PMAR006309 [Perkinsus marinus ATCC 50983]EER09803.1 hypothetical protein Pmar_PMAR006309 [Perkinsus marinus ATCC 50983]|eukprot:XP_002778008.1 hypothetical protein Pmar_PMAR006309 [Perkinsus marinus ATCC 50983]
MCRSPSRAEAVARKPTAVEASVKKKPSPTTSAATCVEESPEQRALPADEQAAPIADRGANEDDEENFDVANAVSTSWLHTVIDSPYGAALTDPTLCHGTSLYTDELSNPSPLITDIQLSPRNSHFSRYDCRALVDTGAGRSFIRFDMLNKLPNSFIVDRRDVNISVMVANAEKFVCKQAVMLDVTTPQLTKPIWFLTVKSLSFPLILGLDAIRRLQLLIFASPEKILLKAGLTEKEVGRCAGNQELEVASTNRGDISV